MESSSPCRLCFDGFGDDISICERIFFENETLKLVDIINICVQLKIDENDNFPQSVCGNCKFNLIQFYEFRQKCYETDLFLRVKTEGDVLNKISDIEDDIEYSDFKIEIINIPECVLGDEAFPEPQKKLPKIYNKLPIVQHKLETFINIPPSLIEKPLSNIDQPTLIHNVSTVHEKQPSMVHEIFLKEHDKPIIHKNQPTIYRNLPCKLAQKELLLEKKRPKEKKTHKCDICLKEFRSGSHLRAHYEIHSEQAKYLCVSCGQAFKSKRCLLSHSKKHSGLYECAICERGYSSKSQLESHMRVHTGERPFKCKICNATFKANATLKIHIRRHNNDKPFKCRYCEKSFVVSHHRRTHELVHGDKTNRPYKCIICSKDFQKKELFVQHKKIHIDERQFKCVYCDKEFVYRKNWIVHLRTHTGEKPYNCPLCRKAFAQRVCMRTHVGKAHPDQAGLMKQLNFTLPA